MKRPTWPSSPASPSARSGGWPTSGSESGPSSSRSAMSVTVSRSWQNLGHSREADMTNELAVRNQQPATGGASAELVPDASTRAELPPILLGRATPEVARQVENFYNSVAEIFERWVARRPS